MSKITLCYFCDAPLTKSNSSSEHVILNSIGGRLESKNLLCRKCNSELGDKSDAELSNQLRFLSVYLDVKRDHGKSPALKGVKNKDGKEFHITGGGKPAMSKPEYEEIREGNEVRIHASARNEKELLTILGKAKKKYPDLDLSNIRDKFQVKEEPVNEVLRISTTLGGELAFISILKTGVNFYLLKQYPKEEITLAIDQLKGLNTESLVGHYYPKKSIYRKAPNEVIHLIHLVGNKYNGVIYAYIEFFSSYSFLVVLSNQYKGKKFTETYAYDVVNHKEVRKKVNLNLTMEEIQEIFNSTNPPSLLSGKVKRVMKIATKLNRDKEFSHAFKSIINEIVKNSKSDVWTKEMISELSDRVAREYVRIHFR
ncbi:HNH endonuclease [bacterium SCSIO 12741]|nr:HNH endonuclease [bacterium SCSIO 12741]